MLALLAQTKTGTSNLASTLVTFDNNTVAGNSIVVVSGNSSSTAGDVSGVTDSQGNQYTKVLATANSTIGEIEIWYTSGIIGGANTITVAYTTGVACAVIIREYNGLIYANSQDKSASNTGNSANLSSGNTTALTQNSELLVGAGLIPLANSFSAGGSFVNLVSAGAPLVVAVAAEDLLVTTGGVQAATFTASGSVQWVCAIATFFLSPTGTTTSTSSTSMSSTSSSSTSSSISSTSSSTSSTSSSTSSTSTSLSTSSTSMSTSSTSSSISSTSSSTSSTSLSSTSSSTSISSTSSSISSTSVSSTSMSSTSSSTSVSSTSSSFSSTSSSISSTSRSTSSTSFSSTSSSSSTSSTTLPPPNLTYSYEDSDPPLPVLRAVGTVAIDSSVGGGTSLTVTLPSGWQPGDIHYLFAMNTGNAIAFNNLSGWTQVYDYSVTTGGVLGDSRLTIWSRLAQSGDTNPAITPASAVNMVAVILGYSSGASATGFANKNQLEYTDWATSLVARGPQLTTTYPRQTIIAVGVIDARNAAGASTLTASATSSDGFTITQQAQGQDTNNRGILTVATYNQTVPGDTRVNWTNSDASSAQPAILAAFIIPQGPPTNASNLTNRFTTAQYGNVAADDGDYFIEYGSEYMIREYKRQNTNNTDTPTFAWRGRTTQSTLISPMLVQIYNVSSGAWETLANTNTRPADTDFSVTVSQTTNVSNYYDSNNIVTFRSYQQVI